MTDANFAACLTAARKSQALIQQRLTARSAHVTQDPPLRGLASLLIERAERRPLNAPCSHVDARLADLDQLTDDERATITNVIDALVTKAKLRLITGGAS